MQRSFTYTLLITWFFFTGACQTHYVINSSETRNVVVSDTLNQLDSQLVQIYFPYKKMLEKDMNRMIAVSSHEMAKGKPESRLPNFLADFLLEEGNKYLKKAERKSGIPSFRIWTNSTKKKKTVFANKIL